MDNLKRFSPLSISNFSIKEVLLFPKLKQLKGILFIDDRVRNRISRDEITDIVILFTDVDRDLLFSTSRNQEAVFSRYLILTLISTLIPATTTNVGKHFDKDHATVLYAHNSISNYITTKDKIRYNTICNIVEHIRNTYNYENIWINIDKVTKKSN